MKKAAIADLVRKLMDVSPRLETPETITKKEERNGGSLPDFDSLRLPLSATHRIQMPTPTAWQAEACIAMGR